MQKLTTPDIRYLLAGLLVVAAPCLPLLNMGANFAVDWPNQVWLINYVASFLASHGTFPAVINTTQLIGMPYPVFYGYLFFPLMGVLSIFWNADLTVRIMVIATYALQFILLLRLCSAAGKNRFFCLSLATFVTWTIYPMTNLYNRGAIPEFFATGLLTAASLLWLMALRSNHGRQRAVLCNVFVFLYALAAGTHPITALYGAVFLALLVGTSLWVARTNPLQFIVPILIPAVLALACLLPWVMATGQFSPRMQIHDTFKRVGYYGRSLDSLYARLSPVPINNRHFDNRLRDDNVGPRHLDMQICFPLLAGFLLCLGAAVKSRKQMSKRLLASVVVFGALVALMVWSSTTMGSMNNIGPLLSTIQFAYRLITYINLSLLAGILFMVLFDRDGTKVFEKRSVLIALLSISFVALVIKLAHAQLVIEAADIPPLRTQALTDGLTKMPASFYGWRAYAVTDAFPEFSSSELAQSQKIGFKPDPSSFGEVLPLNLNKGIYKTNVQEFPWSHLFSGNQEIPRYMCHLLPDDHHMGVRIESGGVVAYKFVPDPKWVTVNTLALVVFFAWLIVTCFLCLFRPKTSLEPLIPDASLSQIKSPT